MSDLQPSPDLQALFDRLEEKFKEVWANHYPSPSDTVTDAKPIITEWAKQHDEELAALREENERLRADHERLLDKIKWLGHLGTISQEVAASLLGTVWVQP